MPAGRALVMSPEHKNVVPAWVTDLARQLTLLLDGGLAGGVLDGDPAVAEAARRTAQALVDAALPERQER